MQDQQPVYECDQACVHIICHDDSSEEIANQIRETHIPMWGRVLRISGRTKFFENEAFHHIQHLRETWKDASYVGTVTYSMLRKVAPADVVQESIKDELTKPAPEARTDVLTFVNMDFGGNSRPVETAALFHGNQWMASWKIMLRKLGFTESEIADGEANMQGFYANHWVCKPHLMDIYLEYVIRAMRLMDEDDELRCNIMHGAGYMGSLTMDQLVEICGIPHYSLHTFVLERLPSFIFGHLGCSVRRCGHIVP